MGLGRVGVDVNVATQAKRQLILRRKREVAGVVAVEPQHGIRHRLPDHVFTLEQNIATSANRPPFNKPLTSEEQSLLRDRDAAECEVVRGDDADVTGLPGVL